MPEPSPSPARGRGRIPPWVEPEAVEPVRAPQNRSRPVPSPWLDCDRCGWRHYPGFERQAWEVVTVCASCGAELPARRADAAQ
jgi:hypothetical protein